MSCASLKYQIKRNNAYTSKIMTNLMKENGNVLYLGTEYANASFVWTYKVDTIQIYKLINGKINSQREYDVSFGKDWLEQLSSENLSEQVFDCTELDGDLIEIRIREEGVIMKHSFSVNLDCFVNGKYESEFLNRVIADMKAYNIKW